MAESNFFGMKEIDFKKTMKMLEESIRMYEKTKKDTAREMRNKLNDDGTKRHTQDDIDDQLSLIQGAEDEQIAKYKMFGGDIDVLLKEIGSSSKKGLLSGIVDKLKPQKSPLRDVPMEKVRPAVSTKVEAPVVREEVVSPVEVESVQESSYIPDITKYKAGETFDVIPLPSNGECYKMHGGKKAAKVAVSYLTAYDENMIVSPNLYRDGVVLDYLLNAKIKDFPINPNDMLDGDREAILLFLRASGYGVEYPVLATDGESGEKFDTTIDLSKIKYKEFKLKGDENGYFEYVLPQSKAVVKFKFLTHGEKVQLKRLEEAENMKLAKYRLKSFVDDMDFYAEHDDTLDKQGKTSVRQAIREIEKWEDGIDDTESNVITHTLTNKMKFNIVSINGNTDRDYIDEFVDNMPVKESAALRSYIFDNEPGLDYNITVEKPKSLGGGSMNVFLQFNEYIFLNIARQV